MIKFYSFQIFYNKTKTSMKYLLPSISFCFSTKIELDLSILFLYHLSKAQGDLFSCFLFFIIFIKCYWNKNYIIFISPPCLVKGWAWWIIGCTVIYRVLFAIYTLLGEMMQLLRFKFPSGFSRWEQSRKNWRKHLKESMYRWVIRWWEWWLRQESLSEVKRQHQGMAVAAWTDRLILGLPHR